MSASAYLHSEVLGSEQWIGAGSTMWMVIDPAKSTIENSMGVVHQVEFLPVLKKTRCRVWALWHGYGWLRVRP